MVFSKIFELFGDFIFITAPSLGFLPQLIRKDIIFAPILSTILIVANVFKIMYLKISLFSWEIFLQSVFLIFFHFILLTFSKREKLSILEERIFINKYTEKSYKRYGLFSLIFSLVITTGVTFALLGFFMTEYIFYISCPLFIVLECSVGIVQLLILETESRFSLNKINVFPKELFLMWALGDLLKLAWMIKIGGGTLLCLSVAFQIIVDLAVVFRYGGITRQK